MRDLNTRRVVFIALALALGIASVDGQAGTPPVPGPAASRSIAALPGLGRLFRELVLARGQATPEQAAGALFDFELVVAAVTGSQGGPPGRSLDEYRGAFEGGRSIVIRADRATLQRDDTAYRLQSLGYSAKEIADILAGRITRTALDTAQKMLMTGERASVVSDFLDREYRRLERLRAAAARPGRPGKGRYGPALGGSLAGASLAFEPHVRRYASLYGVDERLVRAVIECESGWNAGARSRAGAIGLMQLMPGTARELGVDPFDAGQNIEGGVRYLAGLLRLFGSLDRALIAYNAGPGFAERYGRGQAALYGETREFVRKVLAVLIPDS